MKKKLIGIGFALIAFGGVSIGAALTYQTPEQRAQQVYDDAVASENLGRQAYESSSLKVEVSEKLVEVAKRNLEYDENARTIDLAQFQHANELKRKAFCYLYLTKGDNVKEESKAMYEQDCSTKHTEVFRREQ